MKKKGLNIALLLILVMLVLPATQVLWPWYGEKPLEGAFKLAEKPVFNQDKWLSGEFQGQVENYLKDHIGFRNFLVRLQNQVDFSLSRHANAQGAVVGKSGQLFEYDYIRSWLALDYPGDAFVEKKLQRLKFVQEFLKREKGIDLVLVFEPGKASFYPEYIPNRFSSMKKGSSTYERYQVKAEELGIEYIDFHQYFLNLKGKTEYPLYPRYGTHWSVYGMWYAADSLLNFTERIRNLELTGVYVDSLVLSNKPLDTDDDVLKTMNLPCPPKSEILAYPALNFDTAHAGDKPMVLVVADSYYWNIFNTRIPRHVFANEAFWYFNTLVYPDHYLRPSYTSDLNFKEEIEKQDIIFLMITERFVHKFDWRFTDQLYSLYTPDWLRDPVYEKINDVMQVESWYEGMIEKAEEKGLSLEEVLTLEGRYLFHKEDTLNYMVNYGPWHFSRIIENEEGWMAFVREQAKQNNTSVEEALLANALYTFKQDFPEFYELNRGLEAMEEWILSDSTTRSDMLARADSLHFDHRQFIRIKAWQLYRDEEIRKSMNAIRSDQAWLEAVRQKAEEKGIPLDEMIRKDAEYLWQMKINKP